MPKSMLESKPQITKINPFPPREEELLNLLVNGTSSSKKVAKEMGTTPATIDSYFAQVAERIEEITGKRPKSRTHILEIISGDILFTNNDPRI